MTSNIARLREKSGLTQREIAQSLGVTETTIANWEKGRSGLEWIDRLIRLCQILDCELVDLIDYEQPEDSEKEPSFEELRAMYKAGKISRASLTR